MADARADRIAVPAGSAAKAEPAGQLLPPIRTNEDFQRDWLKILATSSGASLLGGVAAYLLGRKEKNRKKRIAMSLLAGLAAGGATAAGHGILSHYAWKRKYKGTGRLTYGHTLAGSGSFDPDSDVKIVYDAAGRPTISLFMRGILGHNDSATADLPSAFKHVNDAISEQVRGSIVNSKHLDRYIDRIQRTSDAWAAAHNGERPRIRIFGHSRGGGAALTFAQKLNDRNSGLRVNDIVGLDPKFYPSDIRLFRHKDFADNLMVVRPDKNALQRAIGVLFGADPVVYSVNNGNQKQTFGVEDIGHTSRMGMLIPALNALNERDRRQEK